MNEVPCRSVRSTFLLLAIVAVSLPLLGPGLAAQDSIPLPPVAPLPTADPILIVGQVFDSTRMAPLAGADLLIPGVGYLTSSDAEGGFVISGLPAGTHGIAMVHPRLDSLGLTPELRMVSGSPGETVPLGFAIPPVTYFQRLLCGRTFSGDGEGEGILTGWVVDDLTITPLPGAIVAARWDAEGEDGRRWERSGTDGGYTLCGLPTDKVFMVEARFPSGQEVEVSVDLSGSFLRLQDLGIEITREGEILGRVVDHASDQGVPGAEVRIPGLELRTITGSGGRFRFEGLTSGELQFEVDHLAYGTTRYAVPVTGNRRVDLELRVSPVPIEIEGFTVEVRSPRLEQQGFYRRARGGAGRHFTQSEIMKDSPVDLMSVIRKTPGVTVRYSQQAGESVVMGRSSGFARGRCRMAVIVNGIRFSGWRIDDFRPEQVVAMEIYPRELGVPLQYQSMYGGSGCGAILIWTGN